MDVSQRPLRSKHEIRQVSWLSRYRLSSHPFSGTVTWIDDSQPRGPILGLQWRDRSGISPVFPDA